MLTLVSRTTAAAALAMTCAFPARGMSVAALQAELDKGGKPTVIDLRSPSDFARGHIPGAINIPASLCPLKNLPPLGKVIVYGAGLGPDATDTAAAALGQKRGITVDVLAGGFAAWESGLTLSTGARGMKPQSVNYITYAQLKKAAPSETVLVDLRKPNPPGHSTLANAAPAAPSQPLTDLTREFPGMQVRKSPFDGGMRPSAAGDGSPPPLLVLIDNGDGAAQTAARSLKAGGMNRYVILAGGEEILTRQGQPGRQRNSPNTGLPHRIVPPSGAAK